MYCAHFGFSKSPFRITPDPELFYAGGHRGAVLDALVYAVGRGEGMVEVVGEVGSGKTMLCRMLERELPAHCEIAYLANPRLGPEEILRAIALELKIEVPPDAGKVAVTRLLQDYLLARHAADRRVVMFIEEAQAMPLETLEEIRLLSNLETAQDKLLQIVMFGQPELDAKLALHEIRQLRERITYRFELKPLGAAEVRDYLNARARACGYRGNRLFTPAAIRAITRHSGGLLRRINVLADKALLAAYAADAREVGWRHVRLAARDSEYRPLQSTRRPGWLAIGSMAALLTLALLGGFGWQALRAAPPDGAAATRAVPAVALPLAPDAPGVRGARYQDFAAMSVVLADSDGLPDELDGTEGWSAERRAFHLLDDLLGGEQPEMLHLDADPDRFEVTQ